MAYLNDVVSSSEYTESRRTAASEQETINDSDGSGCGLISGIIQGFFPVRLKKFAENFS